MQEGEEEEREPRFTLLEAAMLGATVLVFPLGGPLLSGALGGLSLGVAAILRVRRLRRHELRVHERRMKSLVDSIAVGHPLPIGIGPYRVLARHDNFYQAVDNNGRQVYLRLFDEALARPRIKELLRRDCSSPRFLEVLDVCILEQLVFLVFADIPERCLTDLLKKSPVDPADALRYGRELLQIAHELHGHDMTIGKVRAEPFYITRSGLQLCIPQLILDQAQSEFDARQCLVEHHHLHEELNYLSPEAVGGGKRCGAKEDQFAAGTVLFRLLTGHWPLGPHDDMVARIISLLSEPPPKPSDLRPGLPSELDEVLARMLAKDPDQRYADCAEALRALDAIKLD